MKSYSLLVVLLLCAGCAKSYEVKSMADIEDGERVLIGTIQLRDFKPEARYQADYETIKVLASYDPAESLGKFGEGALSEVFELLSFKGNQIEFAVKADSRPLYIKGFRMSTVATGAYDFYTYTLSTNYLIGSRVNKCEYIGKIEIERVSEGRFRTRVLDELNSNSRLAKKVQDCELRRNLAKP